MAELAVDCPSGSHIDLVATWCPVQRRDEGLLLVVSVRDPATGQPKPLQGASASFRLVDGAGNVKFDKPGSIVGSDVETRFAPADWSGLEAGLYPFYHQLVDATDGPSGLLQGSFEIVPSIMELSP